MRDREAIEKVRLKERVGGFHQHEEFEGISRPDPTSHAYLPEAERFDTDFAAQDRRRREEEYQRKQQITNVKRERQIDRDLGRWNKMENEEEKHRQKLEHMASNWKAGQKNNSSAAYNPITLDYDPTEQGEHLRQQDDLVKHRAGQRLYNLDAKRNSEFNVITGEPRKPPEIPRRPF